jgi:putative intracellular protease/amidase
MKNLSGKKLLMVIAKNKFRDEKYLEPRKVLEAAGAVVTVAS